jgi:hypothetical protein
LKTLELTEATGSLPEYVQQARDEPLVLTRAGRAVAAVVRLADEDLESLAVGTHPDFHAIIERSRARYREEGGISLDEIRRKYSVGT